MRTRTNDIIHPAMRPHWAPTIPFMVAPRYCDLSAVGHLRRGHVDGMSAFAPIATKLLREGNGRKGPIGDIAFRHSMTSSAVASSEGGTVRPSALAVLVFRPISYLTGN